MSSSTLILTVGGSPAPLIAQLRDSAWGHVVFVCSEDDATTLTKGSYTKVDEISEAAGLDETRSSIARVPADDPNEIYRRCVELIRAQKNRGARVTVNYTGGTKSMSAMLLMAGIAEDVGVAAVLGARPDLKQVQSGTEVIMQISTADIRGRWAIDAAARAWCRFDYLGAAELLGALPSPSPDARRYLILSRGYGFWTGFDYGQARNALEPVARFLPEGAMKGLASLSCTEPSKHSDAARGHDLWLASERHAKAERYDLAVLMLYRATEWIAQWTLRWEHGIDTGNVQPDQGLDELTTPAMSGERRVLGQHAAWQAVARLGGSLAEVAAATEGVRRDLAQKRNHSVLAHGRAPLTEEDHERARKWFYEQLQPAYLEQAFGRNGPHPQLPTELPS